MSETGLLGPFRLTAADINSEVSEKQAGVYALDRSHEEGPFHVSYVGRSDTDVNARLLEHAGKYKRFKFQYIGTPEEAYLKECDLYHQFNPPSTIAHPQKPLGAKWKCPHCKPFSS